MNRYLGNYDFFLKKFCISSVIVAHHAVISLQLVLLLTIMDSIPVLESSIEADLMYDFFVGGICQMMIAVIIFSFL